jgi:hypothetical protein
MTRQMSAEILYYHPEDLGPGIVKLRDRGFKIEISDLIDDDEVEGRLSDSVWLTCRIASELSGLQFFHWVSNLIEPGGDLIEAGAEVPSPVVRTEVISGYDVDVQADGDCNIRIGDKQFCSHLSIADARAWIDAQIAKQGGATSHRG